MQTHTPVVGDEGGVSWREFHETEGAELTVRANGQRSCHRWASYFQNNRIFIFAGVRSIHDSRVRWRWAMADILEKIIRQPADYILTFISLLKGPKQFICAQTSVANPKLEDAIIFFSISLGLYFLFAVTLETEKGIELTVRLVRALVLIFTAIILMATALRLAWRIAGGHAAFVQFFIYFLYSSAVVMIFVRIVMVTDHGLYLYLDPDNAVTYQQLLQGWMSKEQDLAFRNKIFRTPAFLITNAVFWVEMGLIVLWIIASWGALREMNGLSKARSVVAFVISVLLLPAAVSVVWLVGRSI